MYACIFWNNKKERTHGVLLLNAILFMCFLVFEWLSQIREKLTQLQEKRDKINKKWQDKMDHLQIGMHGNMF